MDGVGRFLDGWKVGNVPSALLKPHHPRELKGVGGQEGRRENGDLVVGATSVCPS